MIYRMKQEQYDKIASGFNFRELHELGISIKQAMLNYVNEIFCIQPVMYTCEVAIDLDSETGFSLVITGKEVQQLITSIQTY